MIEHDALDLDLVFPPRRRKRAGCPTCADHRDRLRGTAGDDRASAEAEFEAHVRERH